MPGSDLTDVTVIIPCYNNTGTIEAAVQSALGQTVPVKVIVIDDCSSDDSAQKARNVAPGDPRLVVLIQDHNQGPSAARNRAIAHAETKWVAILDADDRMHPDRLRRLIEQAESDDLDLVADDLIRVEAVADPKQGTRLWSDTPIGVLPLTLSRFARENIDSRTGSRRELGYLKPVMRRDFLESNALAYREDMRLAEDFDLYTRALKAGARFSLIDPCGYFSVDYPNSLSKEYASTDMKPVLARDIELLSAPGLSGEERHAIREHKLLWHKNWSWMRLIESVRARNPLGVARAFIAPPQVAGALVLRCFRHLAGRPPVAPQIHRAGHLQDIKTILSDSPSRLC
ncbi:glycosyltransferase family 2 protein [Hyphomonas sp.]|jgi:succinoglycan biosynthesis protein ExoU|uniref:glycosyltransferase family 2 protein n=1 Tax=Hyphomonas sp. TaxID=87 RepID=UPI0039E65604